MIGAHTLSFGSRLSLAHSNSAEKKKECMYPSRAAHSAQKRKQPRRRESKQQRGYQRKGERKGECVAGKRRKESFPDFSVAAASAQFRPAFIF